MQGSTTLKQRDRIALSKVLNQMIEWRVLGTAVTLFLIFIAGFALVQFAAPGLVGNDGYYHMKMGYLIRTEGLTPAFTYLPLTILNEGAFYDHHMLYHAYLAIFATVDPAVDGGLALTQGAKWASVVLPALAFVMVWWLLRGQRVPYAPVWTLALFAISEPFLYRMSMPRAQSMSLLLLVLGLHWMFKQKYRWLLPLGFVFVWAYNAFPLLLVMAGVYVIATLMLERRFVWQVLLFPAIGIGLGLVINPYFPQNISFILDHLAPKLGESATKVGNEWSAYRTWTLVENSAGALTAVLVGILALGWHEKRISKQILVSLGLTVLFGYMLFESRRFVEYFPPFALIFAVLAVSPILREWGEKRPLFHKIAPLLLVAALVYPLYATVQDGRSLVQRSKDADHYAAAAIWLHDNTESESRIFQTDWDDFTRLFFYNSQVSYTAGLDPTFFELENESLFETWVSITRGEVDNPGDIIRDKFDSDYIFSDLKHDDFLEQAENDPTLIELYRDDDAVIFSVK